MQKAFEKSFLLFKRLLIVRKMKWGVGRKWLLNKIYQKGAEEVLFKAKEALEEAKVFFWLDFGTLLGAVRDGDFIRHDLDIDLGIKLKDYSHVIDEAMIKAGFKKKFQFEIKNGEVGMEQSYELNGIKVDIFYYLISNNKMWTYVFDCDHRESMEVRPIIQFFPNNGFEKIFFKNAEFNVPKNPKEYLAYHYGDDFLVPKKSWDYRKDPLNTKISDYTGVMIKYS